MKIDWYTNKTRPPELSVVVVLQWHWKGVYPSSATITAGEVRYHPDPDRPDDWRVETNDDSGFGGTYEMGPEIEYWCFADDFRQAMPEDLPVKSLMLGVHHRPARFP